MKVRTVVIRIIHKYITLITIVINDLEIDHLAGQAEVRTPQKTA